ncbi:DNA-binding MarR family transcriptional regulator [Mycolicibacterium sp. BK556]|uniref:MarR family winged helix-turn-helix transcriptional regulator n=1 Tax=unclassified Mycolicibacterium TaxID=2636767 RepID=UPI00161F740D|nr:MULTISPECIES: MarR family winged helix-turn-helix transcriptional regulator [unclassified Mycolicibacterium]MBB3600421.1 DNA-binding MarR family transcriptional regulator [Mycolicibacterium sp. BK556]MBB3630173.1 DNA-binding MarR family transcriptional regulator [Mycolicibacterium sp. BK607]MBB3748172.1 DNA-binding MarR family transcriptional regulator [Mycolicibacterium sp. BK634]
MAVRASGSSSDDDALPGAITISLLRVINKIQQGRRMPRDYGSGVSMTLLEAEMCALIGRRDGVTGSELSEDLAVTRSATSQIVSKLKAKGLVVERSSDRDAKRKQLSLTDHGREAAAVADGFKAEMAKAMFGGESDAELRAYLRFVTKLEAFHSEAVQQWDRHNDLNGIAAVER